jgi:glycine cleavage system H protein
MESHRTRTVAYQRCNFSTQLPTDLLYSPSHQWLAARSAGVWRVGLTRFATRRLGEIVDHQFQVPVQSRVEPGQVLGWVEGFKAVSDVLCVVSGRFLRSNAALSEQIALITKAPYGAGWLYEVCGEPDAACLPVKRYCALLDRTIDRLLEEQQARGDDSAPAAPPSDVP